MDGSVQKIYHIQNYEKKIHSAKKKLLQALCCIF